MKTTSRSESRRSPTAAPHPDKPGSIDQRDGPPQAGTSAQERHTLAHVIQRSCHGHNGIAWIGDVSAIMRAMAGQRVRPRSSDRFA